MDRRPARPGTIDMTYAVALLAAIATVNPLRLWPGLPGHDRRARLQMTAAGAALVMMVLVVVAAVSGPVLDALEISDPTARIAAGMGVAVVAVRDAFARPATPVPGLAGRWGAVVPVAVPHLLTPGISLLALSAAADRGIVIASAAILPALAAVVTSAWWAPPAGPWARACRAGHVLVAGMALALGASLVVDGVLDI